jgi:hypothetical protein
MSENTKAFIDALQTGDNMAAGDAFKDALRDKVGAALDTRRQELASSLFNKTTNEAMPHSDPKPEIADPATFDQQGNVVAMGKANDGQAEIDLTQDAKETE